MKLTLRDQTGAADEARIMDSKRGSRRRPWWMVALENQRKINQQKREMQLCNRK